MHLVASPWFMHCSVVLVVVFLLFSPAPPAFHPRGVLGLYDDVYVLPSCSVPRCGATTCNADGVDNTVAAPRPARDFGSGARQAVNLAKKICLKKNLFC